MDMKAQAMEAIEKIAKDKELQALFMKDPEKALEKVLGVDIPDEVADKVIAGVKAKLAGDKLAGGIDLLKKLM